MNNSPDKQTPAVPRGLLLVALVLIAAMQIFYSCSSKTPQEKSSDNNTEQVPAD